MSRDKWSILDNLRFGTEVSKYWDAVGAELDAQMAKTGRPKPELTEDSMRAILAELEKDQAETLDKLAAEAKAAGRKEMFDSVLSVLERLADSAYNQDENIACLSVMHILKEAYPELK